MPRSVLVKPLRSRSGTPNTPASASLTRPVFGARAFDAEADTEAEGDSARVTRRSGTPIKLAGR
jgi:hypothetical protein